ncbi:methyl-accepting chemotaxis protein [Cellvibrio sp.]|uniref:methyl-accepting chemotaxis protein n=1 Tax=Cellvibrio sp. TaxID=1965322 RepID=UPI00396483D8
MKKLSGIKISHKITSLMIGLVVGFLLMAVAYYAQYVSEKTISEANANFKTIDQLISSTLNSAAEIRTATPVYIDTGNEESLSYYRGGKMQINESLNLLGSLNARFVNKNALATAKDSVKKLDVAFNSLIEQQTAALKDAEKKEALKDSLNSAVVAMTSSLQDYRRIIDVNVKRRVSQAEAELNIARTMFAAVLFLTAVGTTLGLFLIYRSIVLPLWHMQRVIAQQNSGNDKTRVRVSANDELGDLGRAFNRLLDERIKVLAEQSQENETLNTSIIGLIRSLGAIAKKDLSIKVPVSTDVTGTISDAVNLLTSETARTLHQVKGVSEQINFISDQLQAQSAVVLQVAEEERTQVSDTVSALDQSAKTMTDIAKEARTANSIATSAIDYTQKAQLSVIQTVEGIQTIRGTISETEKRIKRLGDRSQEITSIVNLINTIAERTHILALNASMHAASAGEAGKGFAVVAEEVQRLAENARGATSEISAMVNNIRVETSDTVNIMNKLITQVAEGTKLAEDSGRRMHETEAATRQLVNHVKSIAVNSMNQANMANRVRDRALLITESTEKTHSKLEEQRVQTDELKNYAHSLVERVNVFTLPEFRTEQRAANVIAAAVVQPASASNQSPLAQPTANQLHLEQIAMAQIPPEHIQQAKLA